MDAMAGSGARYLIITDDTYYNFILPLAEWKHKKGMQTRVVRTSATGTDSVSIRNYIRNAYSTWEVPPEFVLLVGDGGDIPYKRDCCTEYGNYYGDIYYGNMVGDEHAEVLIGRFDVGSVTENQTMVAKTLGYERTPLMTDPSWFRKGTVIIRQDNDGSGDDTIYWNDLHYAASQMESYGYTHIDTLSKNAGDDYNDIVSAVNNGRGFVLYRGQGTDYWWNPFEIYPSYTSNGFKLPIVISPTCHTITPGTATETGEEWVREGSASTPKGAVGYFGTTSTMSHAAYKRSKIARGFFYGAFAANQKTFGEACETARCWALDDIDDVADYKSFITLGDPELNMWTDTPRSMVVNHVGSVPAGPSTFSVNVTSGGSPLGDALVCAMMDSAVYEYGYTNASGNINLSISPAEAGTLLVTATARNHLPYEGYATVVISGVYLTYESHTLDDAAGNNDGIVNPGESISLSLVLRNIGTETARGVSAKLRTTDPYVTVTDSASPFSDIPPSGTRTSLDDYEFNVSAACPNEHIINFTVTADDGGTEAWNSNNPDIQVFTGVFNYLGNAVDDRAPGGNDNSELDVGETVFLTVTLQNTGVTAFSATHAVLRTSDANVLVTDSMGNYGTLGGGVSKENTLDPFVISIYDGATAGHEVLFNIHTTGEGATYSVEDNFSFSLVISDIGTSLPSGPDTYGYWAYDDRDTIGGNNPVYNWLEIGPGGSGTTIASITNADDAIATISIPFNFKFYGTWYNTISVCSNGFAAFGTETWSGGGTAGHEQVIPNSGGPNAFVAGYWDDLNPAAVGDIYQYTDAAANRFIIEYYDVCHYGYPDIRETFQIILYDPASYSTPTGDGEIICQYNSLDYTNGCAVGIENHDETDGIEYLYRGDYDVHASVLAAGRAIKFTTTSPEGGDHPWLCNIHQTINDAAGGNGNGFPESGEDFLFTVTLKNFGDMGASYISGILRSLSSALFVSDSTGAFGTIDGGRTGSNSTNPFGLHVERIDGDTLVYLELALSANFGTYTTILYLPVNLYLDVAVDEQTEKLPKFYSLGNNYPNPFNSSTSFTYSIPEASDVDVSIYNLLGGKVQTYSNENQRPGIYTITWDAKGFPSGVYFYRLRTAKFSNTKRMLLLK